MASLNAPLDNNNEYAESHPTPRRGSQEPESRLPDEYINLDELAAPPPVQNRGEEPISRVSTLEGSRNQRSQLLEHSASKEQKQRLSRREERQCLRRSISRTSRASRKSRAPRPNSQNGGYDVPDNYTNLDELATPSPVENPDENPIYFHKSLEEVKAEEQDFQRNQEQERRASISRGEKPPTEDSSVRKVSRRATQLYVVSYLILFSFFGTLARLGLQAITFYPGAPIIFSELWANFGGSLFMGFLSEDRMLFKEEWGTPTYHRQVEKERQRAQDAESGSASDRAIDLSAAKKEYAATKKTIPLYIGLATGFCGCFTSFSSFIRDAFLAMSNDLSYPNTSPVHRNKGYSFMALLAVILTTVSLCLSGLYIGAHIAIASEKYTPSLPFAFCRKVLDRIAVVLAWGCWLGTIFLAIFPPDRHESPPEIWRGRAVFALVFAPLGCLGRFYASLYLNSKIPSFPLGTFVVNILGTVILGMSYDLQHVPLGGVVGCQVLQGIEDGFCGCLTTVSTWVSELSSLRRRNAYRYGAASVIVALCFLIIIMGSMQWTIGFEGLKCVH